MTDGDLTTSTAPTAFGSIEFADVGSGDPVLFVHGSPGGADEGELMTRFLVEAGFRVICPSRPGYLGTPLTDGNATPQTQADQALALLDGLGIGSFGVACWSGGGPSSYLLTAQHPDRVSALVALAAVSQAYTFDAGIEERMLGGRFGHWLMGEMARHSPKSLVKSTLGAEGDLSKDELQELTQQVFSDDVKRDFVLSLAVIVAGRKEGLANDQEQFPKIGDLGLASITSPTLLVHGTADTDVPPAHSESAVSRIEGAEIVRVEHGTHIATWTDPTSDDLQHRIAEFLRRT